MLNFVLMRSAFCRGVAIGWPLVIWSCQLFNLRAPSSTDVPVLLLNQPIRTHIWTYFIVNLFALDLIDSALDLFVF